MQKPSISGELEVVYTMDSESRMADVNDDSRVTVFNNSEMVPLDIAPDDHHMPQVIEPLIEVKPEFLHDVKQQPPDEYDAACLHHCVKVCV